MNEGAPILALTGIGQSFPQANGALVVIRRADLTLKAGEMAALVGPSGAGKSTLLHIAGLLERQKAGEVAILGQATARLSDEARTKIRRDRIGFVYQYHHLLPEFSALENVVVPQMIAGRARKAASSLAAELLEAVGLGARLDHRPAKLSGGEQQRVAIARALANGPRLLLADEPTGNLDHQTAEQVFALLLGLVRARGIAGLIATHNLDLARRMDRVLTLSDGELRDVTL